MITTNYLTHDANVFYGLEFTFYSQPLHLNFLHVRKINYIFKTISL